MIVMELKKEFIKREIAGESFLVPIGKTICDSNGLYLLTELGTFIWDRLPEARDSRDILQAVLAEYEVDENIARADINEFLDKLRDMGIL